MSSLAELHAALIALGQGGKTAKLYFYFTDPGEMRQQSGFIFVDGGLRCHLSLGGLAPAEVMARLPRLAYSKIASLPALTVDAATAAIPPIWLVELVEHLDPARLREPVAAPAPAPAPAPAAPEPTPAPAPAPQAFYSHVSLQKDVLALLEGIYGIGASKKVESLAASSPPHQYPAEFLAKCRQYAAVMLGDRKAGELFQAIEEKVAGQRH